MTLGKKKRFPGVIAFILIAGALAFLLVRFLGGADSEEEAAVEDDGQNSRDTRRLQAAARPPRFVTSPEPPVGGANVEPEKPRAAETAPVGKEAVVTNAPSSDMPNRRSNVGPQLRALRDFDPAAYRVIWEERRREYFGAVGGIKACGLALVQRKGRQRWMFRETVELSMTVGQGRIRFTDANFPDEGMLDTSDQEFQSCYREAIRKIELSCPECGEGSAVIPWRIRAILFQSGLDPLSEIRDRDPRVDPALIVRTD
jgi:hypothetical protein